MPGKNLAVEGGSRLHELEGRTEVTPSRRLEVIGTLEEIGCREASWSEQLDDNFAERIPVSGRHGQHTLSSPYGMLILKCTCLLL